MGKALKNSTRCISHILNLITSTGIRESKDNFPSRIFVLGMLAFNSDIHILGFDSVMFFRTILCLLIQSPCDGQSLLNIFVVISVDLWEEL